MADDRYGPVPPPPPTLAGSPAAADQWSPEQPPQQWQPAPAAARRRRVPGWLIAVAAATAVASVVAFGTALLWPGGPDGPTDPLAFHRFVSVARIDFDQESRASYTAVLGERGYAAWEQDGDLRVVAFDVTTGQRAWAETVSGADRWSRIYAAPGGLLIFPYQPDSTAQRRMFVLDPATGEERWHADVRGDDHLFLLDGTLTWLDRAAGVLRGLDPASGDERWRQELPEEGDPTAVPVLTEADLTRPADLSGNPSPGEGDHRIVVVFPDRSARVFDSRDGKLLSQGSNIADPDDRLLAYRDRLFVAPAALGYQLTSYELAELDSVPRAHYAAPDAQRYPELLEPCGSGRVCLLENVSFDRQTTELVAVDAVDGGALWRAPAPGAEHVLGVGQWVAVAADVNFQPSVVLYGGDGAPVLERAGLVVRLDGGNLLLLAGIGAFAAVGVAGMATGGGAAEPVDLGQLPAETLAEQCSWNQHYLVCPDRTGADIWQFAGD